MDCPRRSAERTQVWRLPHCAAHMNSAPAGAMGMPFGKTLRRRPQLRCGLRPGRCRPGGWKARWLNELRGVRPSTAGRCGETRGRGTCEQELAAMIAKEFYARGGVCMFFDLLPGNKACEPDPSGARPRLNRSTGPLVPAQAHRRQLEPHDEVVDNPSRLRSTRSAMPLAASATARLRRAG